MDINKSYQDFMEFANFMGPMGDTPPLDGIAEEVRSYLDDHFQFGDSKYAAWWFREHADDLFKFYKMLGMVSEDAVPAMVPTGDGSLYLMGRVPDMDYVVYLGSDAEFAFEFREHLAHEIMHGEHHTQHRFHEHPKKFSKEYGEFIAYLGDYLFEKTMPEPGARPPILWHDAWHVIGNETARQLAEHDGLDYPRFFHGNDERELWGIVNSKVIPKIDVPIPESEEVIAKFSRFYDDILQEIGLDADVEFHPKTARELKEIFMP